MTSDTPFASAGEAAADPRILVFGRLLGAANGLEYLLGRALEEEAGLDHTLFELLLVVGRAGPGGIPVREVAQARVLTSGGATRLVHRAVERGFVSRRASREDGRVQLVELTEEGERVLVRAAAIHARHVESALLSVLSPEQATVFAEAVEVLSKSAARSLPVMP